jgi:peroxiredoxin
MYLCGFAQVKKGKPIYICGDSRELFGKDSVTLYIWEHVFDDAKNMIIPHQTIRKACMSGRFRIALPERKEQGYICLSGEKRISNSPISILRYYMIEPGDSITVSGSSKKLQFSGKGAERYQFRYWLDSMNNSGSWSRGLPGTDYYRNKPAIAYLEYLKIWSQAYDRQQKKQLDELWAMEPVIGKEATRSQENEIRAYWKSRKAGEYASLKKELEKMLPADSQQGITDSLDILMAPVFKEPLPVTDPVILVQSRVFVTEQLHILKLEAGLLNSSVESLICDRYNGLLRDHLLTSYLIGEFDRIKGADEILVKACRDVQTDYCKKGLRVLQEKYGQGAKAPDFKLQDVAGKWKRLSDYKGKVVVMDVWYTGCLGCVGFYQHTLKGIEEKYKEDNQIAFLSISIDVEKETWRNSIESGLYSNMAAINLTTGPMGAESSFVKEYGATGYPTIIVIDKGGKIYKRTDQLYKSENLNKVIEELVTCL